MNLRILLILLVFFQSSYGQVSLSAECIRGALRAERTCFDVTYYDLSVDINPDSQYISGSNKIHFIAKEVSSKIQIDLFKQFNISKLTLQIPLDNDGDIFEEVNLKYEKVEDALFVYLPEALKIGSNYILNIGYDGKPNIAKRAPWDGGFVWSKDSLGRHFAGVACEGHGASSWWPCKDHLTDEPDSMKMTFTVPGGYKCISNGINSSADTVVKRNKSLQPFSVFEWKVSYPINTYNVTFYLGMFEKIEGTYHSNNDTLNTSFYALDYNIEKARKQFEQVNPMLKIYEDLFGKFPFWNDGYKLVEAPYLGMEHQTAIAYGNGYQNGYGGIQPKGVDFDYIIIHETGHEYWGNSISMEDIADMWIHESFCTYTEVLYTEKMYGKLVALNYLRSQRSRISNDVPIVGQYGVNKEGSSDMYNKGSWILHTIRNLVDNDSIWFATLKQFHEDFRLKNTNGQEVFIWFEKKLGADIRNIMERFFINADIPVLEYQVKRMFWMKKIEYRWKKERASFNMPIEIIEGDKKYRVIPSLKWQKIKVSNFDEMRLRFSWQSFLYDIVEINK